MKVLFGQSLKTMRENSGCLQAPGYCGTIGQTAWRKSRFPVRVDSWEQSKTSTSECGSPRTGPDCLGWDAHRHQPCSIRQDRVGNFFKWPVLRSGLLSSPRPQGRLLAEL